MVCSGLALWLRVPCLGSTDLAGGNGGLSPMDRDWEWPHGPVQVPFTEGQSLLLWLGSCLSHVASSHNSQTLVLAPSIVKPGRRGLGFGFLFLFFFLFCSCYQRNKAEAESALKACLSCCYCASPVFSHFHLLVYSYNFIFLFFLVFLKNSSI